MTIVEVLQDLRRRPWWHIRNHWNWKCAAISVAVRGSIFFLANLSFGFGAAMRAWLVDTLFRVPLVGVYGAIDQAFTTAQPVWAASMTVMVLVPTLARGIEFIIHRMAGTPEVLISILVSIALSALSNPLTLLAMRRRVLVVGDGAESLLVDLRRLPVIGLHLGLRLVSTSKGIGRRWGL